MGLGRYVVRRSIYTGILLFIIACFNFFLFQVLPFITLCPGLSYDACAAALYVPNVPPKNVRNPAQWYATEKAVIFKAYGFDSPIWDRFVLYIKDMFTFNFGDNIHAFSGPVITTIEQRLPYTVVLLGSSTVAAFLIGIAIGVVAAAKRGRVLDVGSLATLLFINSLPVFFLGGMLEVAQYSLTNHFYLPVGSLVLLAKGWKLYRILLAEMFLPFLTLTFAGIGGVFLTQRAVMIDTMGEDFIVMARAKGVPERTVLFKHALRNAVLPIVTAFAISIGFILSGAIITETLFQWPGLGQAIYLGVVALDFPLEQAMFFIISIMVVLCLFAADILLGFLDPRVTTG